MSTRYFYCLLSFDETLPMSVREAAEALAKARAEQPATDWLTRRPTRFDALEENLRLTVEQAVADGWDGKGLLVL